MAKRFRFRPTARGIVFVLAALAIVSLGRMLVVQQIELNNQHAALLTLNESIEAANKKNKQFERELNFAKTDAYIERAAHSILGFVREGEYKFMENKQ